MSKKSFTPKPPSAGRNKFDNPKEQSIKLSGFKSDWIIIDDPVGYGDPVYSKGTTNVNPNDKPPETTLTANSLRAMADRMQDIIWKKYDPTQYWAAWDLASDQPAKTDKPDRDYGSARKAVSNWVHTATKDGPDWEDVVGNDAAKQALREVLTDPHNNANLHAFYGIVPPKGVLLSGPPGCGKTMLAKVAAATLARLHGADTEYLLLNATELESKWVGKTEANIRAVFAFARAYHAKHNRPCLIFIDEADAVFPNRNYASTFEQGNIATFLAEMDGLKTNGAFLMLATNRPGSIDEAVLRDGRIDRRVQVLRPSYDDALVLARKTLVKAPGTASAAALIDYLFAPEHILQVLEHPTTHNRHHFLLSHTVNGAMLVGLVERAKAQAFRRDRDAGTRTGVTEPDLRAAVDALFAEMRHLPHDTALREFVETVAIPFEDARARGRMN